MESYQCGEKYQEDISAEILKLFLMVVKDREEGIK